VKNAHTQLSKSCYLKKISWCYMKWHCCQSHSTSFYSGQHVGIIEGRKLKKVQRWGGLRTRFHENPSVPKFRGESCWHDGTVTLSFLTEERKWVRHENEVHYKLCRQRVTCQLYYPGVQSQTVIIVCCVIQVFSHRQWLLYVVLSRCSVTDSDYCQLYYPGVQSQTVIIVCCVIQLCVSGATN
jgi:hypothetical protein